MVLTKNPKTNRWQRWGGGYYLELESMIPNSVTEELKKLIQKMFFGKTKNPKIQHDTLTNIKMVV